ncbi:hypothetical protein IFM89_017524 [Coptis chinensis]|uniref:Pentatricopeptide repeat-containing protein n=1 Tax=Coptis chinensis TaxID=261450 RepID=A0A835HT82_9MAGN|nr:hypothetical protein IFM89_017524 [Coptis chinensis]
MIKGHSNTDNPNGALLMYREMQVLGYTPDHFTFPFVLKACAAVLDIRFGKCVHSRIFKNGASDAIRVFKEMECEGVEPNEITMVNVLVACAQCRDLETGRWVHERVRQIGFDSRSNVILGTAILDIMVELTQFAGFSPDEATLLSLFGSCAHLGALRLGQGLHACVEKTNFAEDVAVGTSIMDMYAKTGDTESAFQIFNGLSRKDVTAWTSMITGFAMHGHGEEALHLFSEMLRDGSVTPDHITFIGVLTISSKVKFLCRELTTVEAINRTKLTVLCPFSKQMILCDTDVASADGWQC